jgi:hypothetical protein
MAIVLGLFCAPGSGAGGERAATLEIEAEVIDPGPSTPPPGVTYFIPITRYRVLKVLHGDYGHDVILVGHDPFKRPPLTVGARHRLRLTREFPEQSTPVNPFTADGHRGLFFCKSVTLLR